MLSKHIEKSFQRLSESQYQIQSVFQPIEYEWYGDWEGRALLAFCNLYAIKGEKIPAMEQFIQHLKDHLNVEGFLGVCFDENQVNEQQLSGHGWLLSGLMEYYRLFPDEEVLQIAKKIVDNLYLRALPYYDDYPCERNYDDSGDVSGALTDIIKGWKLSSDIGCAFICIDGMSRYYELTKDPNAEKFLRKTIKIFLTIDKVAQKMQTHATLTATRGIMRFYQSTLELRYFDAVKSVFDLYIRYGMTDTFENYNWFDRHDTWTEPCAVVDSLILAVLLYKETGDDYYRTLARRIWFNGLSFSHRANGGAGPNSCVNATQPYLKISFYDACFCCTMRYCEGLYCVKQNKHLFLHNDDNVHIDEKGRKFKGDCMLVYDEEANKELLLYELAFPEEHARRYRVFYN